MGKETIHTIGQLKIKMDIPDDVYFDAKDAHVSIERKGTILLNHVMLDNIDNVVGYDSETKEAIYWLRAHKDELIDRYNNYRSH